MPDTETVSNSYTKFVVIAEARTGSSYLITALSAHPQVRAFGEVFNYEAEHRVSSQACPIIETREHAVPYLQRHIFREHPPEVRAVGFKLLYHQPYYPKWNEVWEYLCQEQVAVLHLRRRNLLERYLSHENATRSSKWVMLDESDRSSQTAIKLSARACAKSFEASEKKQREVDEMFAHCRKMDLWYEDLVRLPQIGQRQIQHFLGLDFQEVRPKTRKQALSQKHMAIANYRPLKQRLSRGVTQGWVRDEWLDFFDE